MKLENALKGNVNYHTIRPYVLACLSDNSLASESCMAELELAANYVDCTYFILRVINTEMSMIKQQSKVMSENYSKNVLSILDLLLKPEKKLSGFLGNPPEPKTDLARHCRFSHLRNYFTQVWKSFLNNDLSDDTRVYAVRFLGDGHITRLSEIRLLADYILPIFDPDPENKLSESEAMKFPTSWSRAVSHTVLGLIARGDLNYPRLYIRLYRLLDESLFQCPNAKQFLITLDIYLSSMHLATSVVASFIKRLSQLSLFSPPLLTPAILLIISNCLKRHSQCRILINYRPKRSHVVNNTQADHDGDADDNGNVDENSKNTMDVQSIGDPYNWEAETFETSKALDSSLWEVSALTGHYSPSISTLAKKICNPDPLDSSVITVSDLIDKEIQAMKKTKKSVKEAMCILSQTNMTMPELPPLNGWV